MTHSKCPNLQIRQVSGLPNLQIRQVSELQARFQDLIFILINLSVSPKYVNSYYCLFIQLDFVW